jgi:hypothetical protein
MKILLISVLVVMAFNTNAKKIQNAVKHGSPVAPSGFTLVQKREGIALYERWFPFDSTINAREIKIVFEARSSMGSAINLLRDESSSNKWNPNISKFRVMKEGTNQWISYIRYDLPWPVADHDCVLRYFLDMQSESKSLVSFESGSHRSFPAVSGTSRLADIKGTWQFAQQKESIHIEYSVTTKPSSTLPRWMTDPIVRNNLLDMMVKFRNVLEVINN